MSLTLIEQLREQAKFTMPNGLVGFENLISVSDNNQDHARATLMLAAANELERSYRAIQCCLSFIAANDREKPFTDSDMMGEMVPVRLTGLCALADIIQPGCREKVIAKGFFNLKKNKKND
jgi:hypothetical protein